MPDLAGSRPADPGCRRRVLRRFRDPRPGWPTKTVTISRVLARGEWPEWRSISTLRSRWSPRVVCRLMITDPRTNATQGRRWALWLFMFVGVVLHSSLCPPNVHAEVLGATRTCVSSAAATAPPEVATATEVPDSGRAGDADRPCAPAPRPHHHPPCGVMSHRGSSHQRSVGPWQTGGTQRCPLPAAYSAEGGRPGASCHWGRSSRPAARRSGAGLLIDLCSSRT
jgi:hypothetical protein